MLHYRYTVSGTKAIRASLSSFCYEKIITQIYKTSYEKIVCLMVCRLINKGKERVRLVFAPGVPKEFVSHDYDVSS